MITVYVRRTPREREVFEILGTSRLMINRELQVDDSKMEEAKSLAILGLIEIRKII
jgi:hypothetical protein